MFSSFPHMLNCRYFEQEWIVIQYIAFADANVWNVSVKLPITELELKIAIILLLTYCASNIQYCIQKYRPYNYAYSFVLLQLEFKQQHWAICSTGSWSVVWFNSSSDVKKKQPKNCCALLLSVSHRNLRPAKERRRYFVTTSLIGWVQLSMWHRQ